MQASGVAVQDFEDKTEREQLSLAVTEVPQPVHILDSCWDSDTLTMRHEDCRNRIKGQLWALSLWRPVHSFLLTQRRCCLLPSAETQDKSG